MTDTAPLYLGFDLSTQQLKAIAVTSDLKVAATAVFDFDRDAQGFDIKKGVMTNEAEREVFAPVAMWLQAVDSVLAQLKKTGVDLGRIQGISGAGMQHGSVYWSEHANQILNELDDIKTLQEQLNEAFSYPYSPNWQDASTQAQCDLFDNALGDEETLAEITGSKAHHVRSNFPLLLVDLLLTYHSVSLVHRFCVFDQNIRTPMQKHHAYPLYHPSWLPSFLAESPPSTSLMHVA